MPENASANNNTKITFEGLLLFTFSPKTSSGLEDRRSRCEIGIVNQTDVDEHEVKITIHQERSDSDKPILVNAGQAGMTTNPLIISQDELKKYSRLYLYLGSVQDPPPTSGSVVRDATFNDVLDLEGTDFYPGGVKVVPGRHTPLCITTGTFSGIGETGVAEYCRVSKSIVETIKLTLRRPLNWQFLLDPDKRLLDGFFRKASAETKINASQSLVLKGELKAGGMVTLFSLPEPSTIGAERFLIGFTNEDKNHPAEVDDLNFVIFNCSAFLHHTLALTLSNEGAKSEFGLSYNFDFDEFSEEELEGELGRSDNACCLIGQLGQTDAFFVAGEEAKAARSANGGAKKSASKKGRSKKTASKKGQSKKAQPKK